MKLAQTQPKSIPRDGPDSSMKLQLNDPDAGVWTWYIDSGLLKKQVNGAAAIECSYNGLERVVSQTLTPTGNGAYNGTFTYGTSAGANYGRLKTATSTGGAAYTYWHDVPGRMTAMWQTSAGLTQSMIDGPIHGWLPQNRFSAVSVSRSLNWRKSSLTTPRSSADQRLTRSSIPAQ